MPDDFPDHPYGVFNVVFLDVVMPHLKEWLASRGLRLFRMPDDASEDGQVYYGVGLTDRQNALAFPDSIAAKEYWARLADDWAKQASDG
jgi:hypothetical protein